MNKSVRRPAPEVSSTHQRFLGVDYKCYDGRYFTRASGTPKGEERYLHRAVWKHFNGPIPKGEVIHHDDDVKSHNWVENLFPMRRGPHTSLHYHKDPRRREAAQRAMRAAIKAAAKWHGSEEGRAWHRVHYEETKDKLQAQFATVLHKRCVDCGKPYTTVNPRSKFCSANCRTLDRAKRGVDDVTSVCKKCCRMFRHSKYKTRTHCSRRCALLGNTRAASGSPR